MKMPLKHLPLAAALSIGLLSVSTTQASIQWAYEYNSLGLVSQVDGPRTDVSDLTQFEYDSRGRLIRVVNALGHASTLSNYNAYGLPQQVTDARGVSSTLSYDGMGRLLTQTLHSSAGDITTSYEYDLVGLLTKVTLADGSWISYEYDDARRLIAVENQLGERIEYTLDNMGNRTQEQVRAADGQISTTLSHVYDEMGRLLKQVGAQSQTTALQYDVNSNLTQTTDANLNSSGQAFDALQRLVSQTDAYNQVTQLTYDQYDNLTSVTDPRNLTTTYQYDEYNRLTQRNSPDTGITTYRYDEAGNIIESTDARGVISQYSYDALNRLTLKHFPADPTQDIAYIYDEAPVGTPAGQIAHTGIGQLTHSTDQTGGDYYTYDDRGNLIEQSRHTAYAEHQSDSSVSYQWDLADKLTTLTYPSGLSVNYQRNPAGQVTDVSYHFGTTPDQVVASNITYQPFGDVEALTWGNGLVLNRVFDQDGRLIQQDTSTLTTLDYVYDPVGNIITQTTNGSDAPFEYDALNRLTSEESVLGREQYIYDEVGNRLDRLIDIEQTDGSIKVGHAWSTFSEESNRLATHYIGGTVVHTENGNITSGIKADQFYLYNQNNRYSEFKVNNVTQAEYFYNARGERILKKRPPSFVAQQYTLFTYSPNGQLLSEAWYSDTRLIAVNHYLWLDQLPLAFIEVRYNQNGDGHIRQLAYIHSDHLNTPRLASNDEQAIVWRSDADAFGRGPVDNNPDGDSINTLIKIRFPGQYYDTESGLFYNYYRNYDPNTGRYIESDPIGLRGGLNTYAYVYANPLRFIDPLGLDVYLCKQPAFGISWNPVDHHWIKTDTIEAGMGGVHSSCGNAGNELGDSLGDPVQVCDHSMRDKTGATCELVEDVDEDLVNQQLQLGRPLGNWWPTNQCQTFAAEVLRNASTKQCSLTRRGVRCR
ncbi:RHS repeat protein [Amphritea pacifica]|uniref:RHS repeat protein n=1 Tax=Amphritea pacifica TaxID=2811233 RepID=A0ABS2WEK6_9GAMM|nr:RHS repeat protein [Amphritea pacifica]MBN0989812.1 RHS repeat protein [Amphritea pacifica]